MLVRYIVQSNGEFRPQAPPLPPCISAYRYLEHALVNCRCRRVREMFCAMYPVFLCIHKLGRDPIHSLELG